MPLLAEGVVAGRLTSCEWSDTLEAAVGLGWLRARDGAFPESVSVDGETVHVVSPPFYDPEGVRVRG
jgi:glycine cleavage system aminomethyltransferase T